MLELLTPLPKSTYQFDKCFSQLINTINNPVIILSLKHQVELINPAACKILAVQAEQILGKPFVDLCQQQQLNELFPEKFISSLKKQEQLKITSKLLRETQNIIIDWTISQTVDKKNQPDGYLLIGNNVTYENLHQENVEFLENLYQEVTGQQPPQHPKTIQEYARSIHYYLDNIIACIPGSIYWKDRNCTYLGGNFGAAKLANVGSRKNILGKTDYDFAKELGWEDGVADCWREDDKEVMATGIPKLDIVEPPFLRPDGTTIYQLANKVPLRDEAGKVIGLLGISVDVTKLRLTEQKLQKLQEKLEIRVAERTKALRKTQEQVRQHQLELAHFSRLSSIGEIASGIAHEINQPLTAIVQYSGGCVERLQQTKAPDEIIQVMQRVVKQAERAGAIIHRLKNFLRKGELQKALVDVNEVITEALKLIEFEVKKTQTNIQLILFDKLPQITIDKIQIQQVILNLIQNAMDAMQTTPQPTITIQTACTKHNKVAITLCDNGPGIPQQLLDKIFTPFFTTKEKGMGIGLSLSRYIVDAHQGQLTVNSKPGNGTQFCLTLPAL